jgi:LysM repeat protein
MGVDVDISIDHVTFNMLSPRETETRFLLTFNTRVVEQEETRIIRDIEFAEMEPATLASQASMTVYIVQPNDTLWKIAKRYNTPLDELLTVNEIEHSGKISAGQKLLILKRGM